MSDSQPNDQLSKDMAKKLVDMIAEVERNEANRLDSPSHEKVSNDTVVKRPRTA